MLPTSHLVPIIRPSDATAEGALADAFAAFIASASRMEVSYGELQNEVTALRRELEVRNTQLTSTLQENQRIRGALHRILDSLPCGVLVLDARDRSLVLINPESYRLLGVVQNPITRFTDFSEEIRNILTSAASRDDEHEFSLKAPQGTRWLSVRRSNLRVPAGEQEALPDEQVILILRDVTARKNADEQREASRNMVALGQMAAVLAHEIRNPLGSMELITDLLARQNTGNESQEWIEHLQVGVRSLSATVNNVLQLHSTGGPNLSRLKLSNVLNSGFGFIRPLAQRAEVTLILNDQLGEAEVLGDVAGLQQIILNLAINAFRHTPAEGSLRLSGRVKPEQALAVVEFADTGSGISAENLKKIFEPGFSGDGHSAGLGLAICHRIMQQHGGSIRVHSTHGRGTTFSLEFPLL